MVQRSGSSNFADAPFEPAASVLSSGGLISFRWRGITRFHGLPQTGPDELTEPDLVAPSTLAGGHAPAAGKETRQVAFINLVFFCLHSRGKLCRWYASATIERKLFPQEHEPGENSRRYVLSSMGSLQNCTNRLNLVAQLLAELGLGAAAQVVLVGYSRVPDHGAYLTCRMQDSRVIAPAECMANLRI